MRLHRCGGAIAPRPFPCLPLPSLSGLRGSCRTSARSRFESVMPSALNEMQSLQRLHQFVFFMDPGFPSPMRQKRWPIMRSTHAGRNTFPERPSQSPRSAAWFAHWAVRSGGERTPTTKPGTVPRNPTDWRTVNARTRRARRQRERRSRSRRAAVSLLHRSSARSPVQAR